MHRHRNQNVINADERFQSAALLALLCQQYKQLQRWSIFNDADDVAHQTVVTAESIDRKTADHVFDKLWRAYQGTEFCQTTVTEHHPEVSYFAAGVTPERQKNRDKALQYTL